MEEHEDLIAVMAAMYAEMISARMAYDAAKKQHALRGQAYAAVALKMLMWSTTQTCVVTPEMEEVVLRRACDELGVDYDTDPDIEPYRTALSQRAAHTALTNAAPNN